MDKRATITEVAGHAGVSRSTVSLVLADAPRISQSTKQRVRASMVELGYVYNRAARAVRAGHSSLIGLILTDIRNPFFAEVTMAIDRFADARGSNVVQGYSFGSAAREVRIALSLVEHQVAGMIMLPSPNAVASDFSFQGKGGPALVQLLREIPGLATDFVGVDNETSGRLLGDHLREVDVHDVLLVGGAYPSPQLKERATGLAQALGRSGTVEIAIGGAEGMSRAIRSRSTAPSCIVSYNDTHVLAILQTLRELGLKPGKDIKVASFDSSPISAVNHPSLTSMDHHATYLAEVAIGLVFKRIEDPRRPIERILVAPNLNVRESTSV